MITAQHIFTYDGTYEGLLSVVFESYKMKTTPSEIRHIDQYQENLFAKPVHVKTDIKKAERVQKGLEKLADSALNNMLYRCFLSEEEDIEMLIYHFIKTSIEHTENIAHNYRDEKILKLHAINKKIGREVHRMHAFVRFQRTKDEIYTALIEPDFNVIPLIGEHFEKRYSNQKWLIYDTRRRYGIFYNMESYKFITLHDDAQQGSGGLSREILTLDEPGYQTLWKSYFDSVNIPERENMKLHIQHVPRRYWKYLVEKHV